VGAEESDEAAKALKQKKQNKVPAENEMDNQLEEERTRIEQEVEICPQGDAIATLIAEDLYPNALKYFSKCLENRIPALLLDSRICQLQHKNRMTMRCP
jgi:hypothetical protein